MDQETITCQNYKNNFVIEPEDFNFYDKIKVPAPTWCPECGLIKRLAWRGERSFFKRKCDLCGNENCSYGTAIWTSKDSMDVYNLRSSELCFECIDCFGCNRLMYSRECNACSSSAFLLNCKNCTDCFGCVNLRNKNYCYFNEQLTKEEYKNFHTIDNGIS